MLEPKSWQETLMENISSSSYNFICFDFDYIFGTNLMEMMFYNLFPFNTNTNLFNSCFSVYTKKGLTPTFICCILLNHSIGYFFLKWVLAKTLGSSWCFYEWLVHPYLCILYFVVILFSIMFLPISNYHEMDFEEFCVVH